MDSIESTLDASFLFFFIVTATILRTCEIRDASLLERTRKNSEKKNEIKFHTLFYRYLFLFTFDEFYDRMFDFCVGKFSFFDGGIK